MSKPTPYITKVSIPLPPEEHIERVMGEKYKPEMLNVTKMLTGTGDCFPPIVALVKALFQAGDMDAKLREVVTLRVATLLTVPYEWQQNAKIALNTGLTESEIDAVAADEPVQGLAPEYILACAATDELVRGGHSQTRPCPVY